MSALEIVAVPILANGEKLLRHFRSIDAPLKRYFIVDNSCGTDESVTNAIDEIWDTKPDHIDEVQVMTNTQNMGFAMSVNDIVRHNFDCKYWIVSNYDLYLEPGEWQRILDHADQFEYGANFGSGIDLFGLFLWTNAVVKNVGLMDENFYPAYFDDNDYRYRCQLKGCLMDHFPVKYRHETSSTINDNPHYKRKNSETFQKLAQYYITKWGGVPGSEKYTRPFNNADLVEEYWKLDPARNDELRWL